MVTSKSVKSSKISTFFMNLSEQFLTLTLIRIFFMYLVRRTYVVRKLVNLKSIRNKLFKLDNRRGSDRHDVNKKVKLPTQNHPQGTVISIRTHKVDEVSILIFCLYYLLFYFLKDKKGPRGINGGLHFIFLSRDIFLDSNYR